LNVLDQYVGCGECMHEQTVRDALDACFASWPQQSWVAFRCPECGGVNHLEVREGSVIEGYLDGAPGPSLVVKRRVPLDDFYVRARGDAIEIRNLNLRWVIPPKSAGR
jgi:hypothetical protein